MDSKLILVDGMPGTGKSSVSQFINFQLRINGFPAQWYHEEAAHPVRLFYNPTRHHSWSDYSEDVASLWNSYANELAGLDHIAVLDAGLFQNHVRSMLIFDADRNAIVDLVHRAELLIAPLHPLLVYLKPKSVAGNFRDVVESRGQRILELWVEAHDEYPYTLRSRDSGYSAFLAFWEEFDQITDGIFETLRISKLRQIVSNDNWDVRLSQTCKFLSLPATTDLWSSVDFACFTGDYVPLEDDTLPGFSLQLRDGSLVASVTQPTFSSHRGPIVRFGEVILIPQGEKTCYLAGWPYVVQFSEDRVGNESLVQATVRKEGSLESGEVYVKH